MSKTTSKTLIERLHAVSNSQELFPSGKKLYDADWQKLEATYRYYIRYWIDKYFKLNKSDSLDLTQSIMIRIQELLPTFSHNGNIGAFRDWLKRVIYYRGLEWRSEKKKQNRGLKLESLSALDQLADPESSMSGKFDLEYDRFRAAKILEKLKTDFQDRTIQAFIMASEHDKLTDEMVKTLGMSRGAIANAKSKVNKRLEELRTELPT